MNGFELVVSHRHLHQRIQLIRSFMHELLPVTKQVTQELFPPWGRIDRLASAVIDDADLFLIADTHRHITDSARYGLGDRKSVVEGRRGWVWCGDVRSADRYRTSL